MTEKRKLIKNVTLGFGAQLASLLLSFFTRTFFVQYLGVELLGITGVITSLIQTLSLTELGFQSAVIFRLYKPLSEEDYEQCNNIIQIFKRIYEVIASLILVLLVILLPFLHIFFKNIEVDKTIYISYFLLGSDTVISYLLAYKRTLVYADRKDYVTKTVDVLCNVFFSVFRILVIYYLKSFFIYLALSAVQTFISNTIIHIWCSNNYKWLHKTKINRDLLKILLKDTSVIFAGKIAAYVLFSTDNLVISAFISTTMVGLYSNYTIITTSLQGIYSSIVQQVVPFIGREYARTQDIEHHQEIINLYTYLRFLLAGCICLPFAILVNCFISWWLGSEYIIKNIIILLSIHLYIQIVYSTLTDYISCSGNFKYDRNNALLGAGVNIISSIIFVKYLGITGVLIGTILSEVITWILYSYVVFKKIIISNKSYIFHYIVRNLIYLIVIVATYCLLFFICNSFFIDNFILDFILKAFICVSVFLIIGLGGFYKTQEFNFITDILKSKMKQKGVYE